MGAANLAFKVDGSGASEKSLVVGFLSRIGAHSCYIHRLIAREGRCEFVVVTVTGAYSHNVVGVFGEFGAACDVARLPYQ
jgi:hypothetical protein